jgi:hypothetical protein
MPDEYIYTEAVAVWKIEQKFVAGQNKMFNRFSKGVSQKSHHQCQPLETLYTKHCHKLSIFTQLCKAFTDKEKNEEE